MQQRVVRQNNKRYVRYSDTGSSRNRSYSSTGTRRGSRSSSASYGRNNRGNRKRAGHSARRHGGAGIAVVILALIVIGIIILYSAVRQVRYNRGVEKYTAAFLPGTSVNGVDLSDKTVEEAEGLLAFTLPDVNIKLQDGTTQSFSLKDVGGSYSYASQLASIKAEQDPTRWEEETGKAYTDISPDLSYDETMVRDVVMQIPAVTDENAQPPVDAYITKTESGFEIVPEQAGSKLDADKLVAAVEASLKEWNYDVDATGCYEQPAIKASDLSLTDTMTAITNLDMLYVNMSGGQSAVIDKATIMGWVVWDQTTNNITLDLGQILIKTQELAQEYNTLGTVRTFHTHGGATIQIGGSSKDTFGYKMDVQTTASRIQNCILSGTREAWAYWPVAGNTRTDENDFGTTYVEVSIQEQHLWYYVNGAVVLESDVVTGEGANSTTPGVFMILDKQSPADLKGDGYVTPVTYWMPVTYTGTGLHDATWRTEFGKEIYVSGGSHGCVNMPLEVVEQLYNQIEMGTPVIIY